MSTVKIHDYIVPAPSSNGTNAARGIPKSYQGWQRFKQILPHREDLIVAGREVKGGIVIHPIIATAILGVLVTIGLSIRSEMNWQHDQIVIIATQKADAEKSAEKERQTLELANSTRDARIQNLEVSLKVAAKSKEKN